MHQLPLNLPVRHTTLTVVVWAIFGLFSGWVLAVFTYDEAQRLLYLIVRALLKCLTSSGT